MQDRNGRRLNTRPTNIRTGLAWASVSDVTRGAVGVATPSRGMADEEAPPFTSPGSEDFAATTVLVINLVLLTVRYQASVGTSTRCQCLTQDLPSLLPIAVKIALYTVLRPHPNAPRVLQSVSHIAHTSGHYEIHL